MKKTLLVALSFVIATVAFSTNSGSNSASAPAASNTIENKSGVSASFNEFEKLPTAPSTENRISEVAKKFSANETMTKAEKKELKKEIKSEIKSVKKELKADKSNEMDVKWIALLLLTIFIGVLSALWFYLQYDNEKPFKLILILSILGLITFGLTLVAAWIITIVNFITKG